MVPPCYDASWGPGIPRSGCLVMAGSLKVSETSIDGCLIIETSLFEDMRGVFLETWNRRDFLEAGLPTEWPQDNFSSSHKNVIRGLHIQRRNPQGKLVRCIQGAVLDLCLDVRPDSPTFQRIHMERLEEGKALYLPPGTAHGFLALEEPSVVYYKCTTLYDRESDGGINWMDDDLNIHWWKNRDKTISSEKDRNLPGLRAWLADPRGVK